MPHRTPRIRRRARRQEGAVIVIVLLIVMMAAGLGTFAAQNASLESRAVGGFRQVQRLNRAGEGFAVAVGALLAERTRGNGPPGLRFPDDRWTSTAPEKSWRDDYGLPGYVSDPSLWQVEPRDFQGAAYPTDILPTDAQLDGHATPFQFGGIALLERHRLPALPGQGGGQTNGTAVGQQAYRYCVTAFTRMFVEAEADETRGLHESIGFFRAYFDVR